jgi:hypothetical protein
MDDMNAVPSTCVFDTSNGIGKDDDTSNIIIYPGAVQVNPVPVGTTVLVQAKIHTDAAWVTIWNSELDPAPIDRAFLQAWQNPFNFVQVVRSAGTGNVKAFATIYSSDTQG